MESLIKKEEKEYDNFNQNNSNNQNQNENKSSVRNFISYDKSMISLSEFNWALDLVQTRNCRVPKLEDASGLNLISVENEKITSLKDRSVGESVGMNREIYCGNVMETAVNEEITRKSDSISVLAPFFDLMNHDSSVNTVFELKFLPQNNGFDEMEGPIIPFLTVRYEGHGVKKGEQVCLNYRW